MSKFCHSFRFRNIDAKSLLALIKPRHFLTAFSTKAIISDYLEPYNVGVYNSFNAIGTSFIPKGFFVDLYRQEGGIHKGFEV